MMHMNVAVPFHLRGKSSGLNEKVQEFNIFYDVDKQDLNKLIEFIQEFPNHQINIEYRNGIDTKTAAALAKIGDNVRFRLRAEDVARVSKLKDNGCRFFFDVSCACDCWTTLYNQVVNEGASEVYICNDLCYDCLRVRNFCDMHSVKMRIVINKVPITRPASPEMYFIPIYRPQDMPVVGKYFDVVEFYTTDDSYDTHFFDVMYRVYIEEQDWYGNLRELNPDIPFEYPCRGVLPYTAFKRSECNLMCLKGYKCRTCRDCVRLSQSLKDINVQFNPKMVKSE